MDSAVDTIPTGTRILVTGATGFTGAVLVRRLVEIGLDVRAIARGSSDMSALEDLNITWFRGDVFDPATVKDACDGVQYIFHVAAAFRVSGIADSVYRDVHVTSTRYLAQAALAQPDFKRFVHVSTVGVHGHIENPPANEDTPFHPGDIYQKTKAEAETWLHAFAAEQNLPYTVIRPAAIYGPGDTRLLKLFKMAMRPLFILLGSGKCLYHLIHVEDLVGAMILAATAPGALGEAFICGNPTSMTLEGIGRIVAEALDHKVRVVRLPAWPVFLLADLCEAVCRPLCLKPLLYRRRVAFFTKDRSFDTTKLRDVLGYTCRYTNEEGIADTARWYRAHGWL
ncbi:MAG: NAD-dependent epimerase/dehydratase family protein [Kiritimatiellae bacterium]|nr:NAD-dependent epimerase/dehydratase family protein [Kiritimatiellia bacterium]